MVEMNIVLLERSISKKTELSAHERSENYARHQVARLPQVGVPLKNAGDYRYNIGGITSFDRRRVVHAVGENVHHTEGVISIYFF